MKWLRDARVIAGLILLCMLIWNKAHAGTMSFGTFEEAQAGCYAKHAELTALGLPLSPVWSPLCAAVDGTHKLQSYYHNQYANGAPNYDQSWVFTYSADNPNPCTAPESGSGFWTCPPPPVAGPTDAECLARPNFFTPFQFWTGSVACLAGCEYVAANAGNGGEVAMAATGACEGGTDYNFDGCPTGYTDRNEMVGVTSHGSLMLECVPDNSDIDGDGINNDEDPSPDEAGSEEAADTDGDGVSDNKDFAPADETNGEDDGIGDETDNVSTGGGNCDSPPNSTGDGIAAQTAYQTWATRCAVERLHKTMKAGVNVSVTSGGVGGSSGEVDGGVSGGENCVHTYTITGGDPINAQALVEAQRLRCQQKAEAVANGAGAENDGTTGTADPDAHWSDANAFTPDEGGLGWGTSIPALPTILGHEIPYQDKLADLFAILRWLIIAWASWKALTMIAEAT